MADEREQSRAAAVVDHLTSTLDSNPVPRPLAGSHGLMAAMSVLARSLGREVREPTADVEGRLLDPVTAIAESSHLVVRRVTLAPRWWAAVEQPLLVYTLDGAPASVVPISPRWFDPRPVTAMVVDPATGVSARLGRSSAARLRADAWSVAAPLDDTADARELSRWSLSGSARRLVLIVVLALLGALLGLVAPAITSLIFKEIVPRADRSRLWGVFVALLLATVGLVVVQYVRGVLVVRVHDRFDDRFQWRLLNRMLELPASYFRGRESASIADEVLSPANARAQLNDWTIAEVVTSAFALVNLVVMIAVSPGVGLVLALLSLVMLVLRTRTELRLRAIAKALLAARASDNGRVLQMLHNIVSIRGSDSTERMFEKWARGARHANEVLDEQYRSYRVSRSVDRAWNAFATAVLVAATVMLGSSSFTAGGFMAFYVAFLQFLTALRQLSLGSVAVLGTVPIMERADPILGFPTEYTGDRRHPGLIEGRISLRDVVFRYEPDGPPILDGLSLEILPGEFVALVGASGSGKSTVLRLLLGVEQAESGSITIDGSELETLDQVALRRQFGVVLQEGAIFGGTVREVIAGANRVSDDDVLRVVRDAGLEGDLARMPNGLDTDVGNGGSLLSGGQRQRILIARAIVTRPRVLLLDEATSALDNVTQSIVSDAVSGLTITRIAVAHRLSTIMAADRVVVVNAGRVVEQGPPRDLVNSGGPFSVLAARQTV